MIVTSMQLTISSRRDIAVLQKESSALEDEEDVNESINAKCRQMASRPPTRSLRSLRRRFADDECVLTRQQF
jgi:hypothetical protein